MGDLVSRGDLETLIATLERLPGSDREGFFGPDSMTWRINRESAVFLGAGRAALLQLAHPWVAASLVEHSNLLHDAIGRFHGTFRVIYTMLFGTRRQAVEASRRLHQLHTTIRGETRAGAHYEANEIGALRWVFATLVESALLAYGEVLPGLRNEEREQYYAESKRMAALFGIPAEALPLDWRPFKDYVEATVPALEVGPDALALSRAVLSGAGTRIHPPGWYHGLTSAWMPEVLRTGFELPAPATRTPTWLRLYGVVPALVRYVGPYHEARARLEGRAVGGLVRRSNQFWMGVPRLLYSELD